VVALFAECEGENVGLFEGGVGVANAATKSGFGH